MQIIRFHFSFLRIGLFWSVFWPVFWAISWAACFTVCVPSQVYAAEVVSDIAGGFDHEMHLNKVFKPLAVNCNHCHNFTQGPTGTYALTEGAQKSALKMTLKEICHECHQSEKIEVQRAPKACFTCHKSMDKIRKIKPLNHESISWRTSHAVEARVKGTSCTNCHMSSQCSKCHLQRNDVDLRNHPKNFKFFHSVQARAQPQRCDQCHTKSYCTTCHLGQK